MVFTRHIRAANCFFLAIGFLGSSAIAQETLHNPVPYLRLSQPQRVLQEAQSWEGDEFPHTMSVLELNRDGFRYWGWYGLNEGKGIGLARSNDLIHWIKDENNPLWTNARWPSVLQKADKKNPLLLYFALTRNYDTPSSYIILASSLDGLHLKEEKILVAAVPNQSNQNPNLFQDPQSGVFYLTYYRGNDKDDFEIVSRHAVSLAELDKAAETIVLRSSETIAAPTLLFLKTKAYPTGVYFLATEVYPHRYSTHPEGEWQVKIFSSDTPDRDFQPVSGDPILRGQRACFFQHVFNSHFYGYDCHQEANDRWILEEVEASLE